MLRKTLTCIAVMTFLWAAAPMDRVLADVGAIPMPAERAADSYAIYSLLMPGASSDKISPPHIQRWGIADTTVNISDMNPAVPPRGQLKAPLDNVQAFNEAARDFEARKYERFQLRADGFHQSRSLPLLNEHQISDLRNARSGDSGVAFFSAVYFNNARTAALVYVNVWCANLCSAGEWVYLEKHGGNWVRRSGIYEKMS
jgi:hypothetical protein